MKTRKFERLTFRERVKIEAGVRRGLSREEIASRVGRSLRGIYMEINRHSGPYRAKVAQREYEQRMVSLGRKLHKERRFLTPKDYKVVFACHREGVPLDVMREYFESIKGHKMSKSVLYRGLSEMKRAAPVASVGRARD